MSHSFGNTGIDIPDDIKYAIECNNESNIKMIKQLTMAENIRI